MAFPPSNLNSNSFPFSSIISGTNAGQASLLNISSNSPFWIKGLPQGYYFKKYPKTKVGVYDYKGPYEHMSVFYQKFYEIIENDPKIDNNSVFEMYVLGPTSQKSSFDYLSKIGFPAPE